MSIRSVVVSIAGVVLVLGGPPLLPPLAPPLPPGPGEHRGHGQQHQEDAHQAAQEGDAYA